MNMNFSKISSDKQHDIFIKIVLIAIFVFVIFIAGAITALAPQFVVRLLPVTVLFIILVLAVFSKTDRLLNDKTLKVWLAILLCTMALWPTYMVLKVGGLPAIDARRIVAGVSLAAMIFFVISRKPIFRALTSENIGSFRVGSLLITTYALWRMASCFVSPSPVISMIQVFWEILYYYCMFFIGALFFSRHSLHNWGMIVFMTLAVLISCYAGVEWLLQKNLLIQYAPANDDFAEFQAALSISRLRDGFFRSQGTFEHPLLLAEFSAMAVCFGMAAMLWPHNGKSFRWLGAVSMVSAIAAALFTGSRSALITVAVGGGLVFMLWLFSPKQTLHVGRQSFRKLSFVMSLITALAIALPAASLLMKGKSRSEITSTEGRIQMINLGLPSIQNNPFLGTGPGTAGMVAGITTGSGLATLDNYFLAIAIESGLPAIFLLLACLLYPVWLSCSRLMSGKQSSPQLIAAVAGALLVVVIAQTVLWMPNNLSFAFLFSGVVTRLLANKPPIKDLNS